MSQGLGSVVWTLDSVPIYSCTANRFHKFTTSPVVWFASIRLNIDSPLRQYKDLILRYYDPHIGRSPYTALLRPIYGTLSLYCVTTTDIYMGRCPYTALLRPIYGTLSLYCVTTTDIYMGRCPYTALLRPILGTLSLYCVTTTDIWDAVLILRYYDPYMGRCP